MYIHIYTHSYTHILELEFVLRPTVSRPVRLGIGPAFGTLDQIVSCSSFDPLYFHRRMSQEGKPAYIHI
jgi:hypothetical protein